MAYPYFLNVNDELHAIVLIENRDRLKTTDESFTLEEWRMFQKAWAKKVGPCPKLVQCEISTVFLTPDRI
jgi:hypothetical protein